MTDPDRDGDLIELEPLPPTVKGAGEEIYETARGRRNRIAIGRPTWLGPPDAGRPELAGDGDVAEFPAAGFEFHALRLALTLLPDTGCRFSSADLILRSQEDADAEEPPLILGLDPARIESEKVVEVTTAFGGKLGAAVFKILSADIERSRVRREELTAIEVALEGFGIGTAEAGWRFRITGRGEVPLTSRGLTALVVRPRELAGAVTISVVAEIEIESVADRWLTWAFRSGTPTAWRTVSFPS